MMTSPTSNGWEMRPVEQQYLEAVGNLHADVFGPGRFARAAYRVREGAPMHSRYCRIAYGDDGVVAAVTFTKILIGGADGALLLGPLAVRTDRTNQGFGRALVGDGLAAAVRDGLRLVVLVGDTGYYGRMGFTAVRHGQITFPGPVDPARILACELVNGALEEFSGIISAAA